MSRRENRPEVQGYMPDWGTLYERWKNKELGKDTMDMIQKGIVDDYNSNPDLQKLVHGVGDFYQDLRTVDGKEKYNPLNYLTAGTLRTLEGAGWLVDKTAGKFLKDTIHNTLRVDPRIAAIGSEAIQIAAAPKAISKGIRSLNKAIASPQAKNLAYKAGQSARRFKDRLGSVPTTAYDDAIGIFELPPEEFRALSKLSKQPGINSLTLARRFQLQKQALNKKYGHIKSNPQGMMDGSVDPKDVPRSTPVTWRTPGQKSQPLNFLFGEKAGWRGGRLNLKSWRERGADKNIAEQFLTAPGKGVVFSSEAAKKNPFMAGIFGIEGAKKLIGAPQGSGNIFQAHHQTATKAVLTGQEGLVYDSQYYHEIQKVWEDLELTLGNNPDNIIGTLGLVQRDLDSPHSLIHKFLDSKMGPDGTKFWTPEKMNEIVTYDDAGNAIGHKNFKLRKKWTKEQALIFKEAVDLLKLAHRQYYLAKGVKPGAYLTTEPILDAEIVDSFVNKLPPIGGTGKYTTSVIKRIAKEIAEETNVTPTVKPSIQDVFDNQAKEAFDKLYKFAVNQSNGEDMVLDVIFNGLTPRQAINRYKGNDPNIVQLSIRFNKALKQAKTTTAITALRNLYMRKYGEVPPAVNYDLGSDD